MTALLPDELDDAAAFNAGMMELGALVCTARSPRCDECPLRDTCAWRLAGSPAGASGVRKQPRFAGSDRQRRGLVMAELRGSDVPVSDAELALVLPDPEVRGRVLSGLAEDGLAVATAGGWTLPTA
jgi:A/G-specific adenine glycosylase